VSYRDDLDAAQARANALAHEVDELRRENQRLRTPQAATPPRPWRRSLRIGLLAVLAFALALGGLMVMLVVKLTNNKVSGTISSTGGELGTWTMHPDRCQSGARNQFRGVQLFEDGDLHGTAYLAPVGGEPAITVNIGTGGSARRFGASECRVLDGSVEPQNSTVNDVRSVEGHVRFDCTWHDEHVTGDVTFGNCH
jgi:hypothetical protein